MIESMFPDRVCTSACLTLRWVPAIFVDGLSVRRRATRDEPLHAGRPRRGHGQRSPRLLERRVIENCLYGVDLNPLAVDLARLALWLETVTVDRPLTFLDHHLKYGNSLIGAGRRDGGDFEARRQGLTGRDRDGVSQETTVCISPLAAIATLFGVREIREGESEVVRRVHGPAVKPFNRLADVWIADAAGRSMARTRYADAAERG